MAAGRSVLEALPELSGEFLLKGGTGIARRDWGAALANLWIVVEQITSSLWERRIVRLAQAPDPIPDGSINSLIKGPGPSRHGMSCCTRLACCPVGRSLGSLRRATRLRIAASIQLLMLHKRLTEPPRISFRSLSQNSQSPYWGHVPGGGVGAVGNWPVEATATSLA
jgi:hypothetical protein